MTSQLQEQTSARRDVMARLRELWGQVRAASYFVKRGPITWPGFPFTTHERAVAILVDDQTLFKVPGNDASLSFEVGARMPKAAEPELDDGLLDELIDDVEWVVRSLIASRNTEGDSLLLKSNLKTAQVLEWHDPEMRVQGVVTFLDISY